MLSAVVKVVPRAFAPVAGPGYSRIVGMVHSHAPICLFFRQVTATLSDVAVYWAT